MANIVKHRFVSAKTNGPDATQIQPSNWNDGHLFTGGAADDLLTRDPTDATFGAKWGPGITVITDTSPSGIYNDYVLPGRGANTYWHWVGASASLTLTGIAGGQIGHRLTIKNISNYPIFLPSGHTGSAASNRFYNPVSSGPTPLATQGYATYVYTGVWVLIGHEQGGPITAPFAAGNFTATGATWTVGSPLNLNYCLNGRCLTVIIALQNTALSVPSAALFVDKAAYGGYVAGAYTATLYSLHTPTPFSGLSQIGTPIQTDKIQLGRQDGAAISGSGINIYAVCQFYVN